MYSKFIHFYRLYTYIFILFHIFIVFSAFYNMKRRFLDVILIRRLFGVDMNCTYRLVDMKYLESRHPYQL